MTGGPVVGFIGIGSMGWPMAARVRQGGFEVLATDSSAERAAAFAKETGCRCTDAGELAATSDILVTMLPTSAIVEDVIGGIEERIRPGALLIEMSSGVPARTQALAARLQSRGIHLIDAPVSGGVKRAVPGDLAIMVGGDAAQIERARPVLACMGSSILGTGQVGSAHAMKALNNLVSAAGFAIGVEALLIGQRFGLEPAAMVDVLNSSTGMNNSTQKKFKQFVLSRKFDSGFGLDLMLKDLTIALTLAQETRTPAPMTSMCRELWASAAGALGSGKDHTEFARLLEMLGGEELAP